METRSIYSLDALGKHTGRLMSRMPKALRIVLESVLRNCDGTRVTEDDVIALAEWRPAAKREREIPFVVGRVVLNDMAGIPMLCDLAAMRDAVNEAAGSKIAPMVPVDMVIDHSLSVDFHANHRALELNMKLEVERNLERFRFVKWAMQAFPGIRLVPPGFGILHQLNLEFLSPGVLKSGDVVYPDSLVGTDSHTCMIAGLGVMGWGVGGIEAEAAMLGEPVNFLTPDVVGVLLTGKLGTGVTSTDLVLHMTEFLRREKVVGTFVEFLGDGVNKLTVQDRASVSNMAVEYGATIGYFPVDHRTIAYMKETGRNSDDITRVQAYFEAQGLFGQTQESEIDYSRVLKLNLGEVEPCVAGPKRPQDRVALSKVKANFRASLGKVANDASEATVEAQASHEIRDGHVLIAAITSCTNTSNPSVMLAAGILARNARRMGLVKRVWVKTSLTPGSVAVSGYLKDAGLQEWLDQLGFHVAGYSCATCVGNSGPLDQDIERQVRERNIVCCAALSGNRNFEGRIHPAVRAAYLMSPPLVVAYALAGTMNVDLKHEPLGYDPQGKPVYLQDIWPDSAELERIMDSVSSPRHYERAYQIDFEKESGPLWKAIPQPVGGNYVWEDASTYIQRPPYFTDPELQESSLKDIQGARALLVLGDSITTDHISPIGSIDAASPAAEYLRSRSVAESDFNSYGARRMNHEVMVRGAFSNIRLRNLLLRHKEGGYALHQPSGALMTVYEAGMRYKADNVPLLVFAGEEYGTGSARDWAAKATRLLGVRAVLARSFERIHRSNLIGMGVIPCELPEGWNNELGELDGTEIHSIFGLGQLRSIRETVRLSVEKAGKTYVVPVMARIDTRQEIECLRRGGILQYMLSAKFQTTRAIVN